jgi:nucleoside-diphosphate-sugar epimerase
LLCAAGHTVVGTTRSAEKADAIAKLGAAPVVVDVFDAPALARAVAAAAPQVMIHQLTDLAFAPGTPQYNEGLERNARLRIEGTPNLVAAAKTAGVRRLISQSIAFVYAPGDGMRVESDPLDAAAQAGLLAVSKGARGIYNLAEDDGAVSSEKAKRELGFDASFRIKP